MLVLDGEVPFRVLISRFIFLHRICRYWSLQKSSHPHRRLVEFRVMRSALWAFLQRVMCTFL